MPRMPLSLLAVPLLLCACGPDNTGKPPQVTVEDNGTEFTYTTVPHFEGTVMQESDLTPIEQQMFDAVNAERARGGTCYNRATGQTVKNPSVPALILEKHIHDAAEGHAASMVKNNFAAHLDPYDQANWSPTRRMVGAGYKPNAPLDTSGTALFFEESLAYGYLTPAEVVDAWKQESFDHCMTLYVPLTYGAVAVKEGRKGNDYPMYWVLNVSGVMPLK